MNATWKKRLPIILGGTGLVLCVLALARFAPARADADAAAAHGRYTVIETEAHNLIVTDNKSNTVYFYTVDKDKEVGSELKLRGSIDLSQVGKPTISVTKAKAE